MKLFLLILLFLSNIIPAGSSFSLVHNHALFLLLCAAVGINAVIITAASFAFFPAGFFA
jgi:hypothetical protein